MDWLCCTPRDYLLSAAGNALLALLPWAKTWTTLQKMYVKAEGSHFIHTERQPWPQAQASEDADQSDIHISR